MDLIIASANSAKILEIKETLKELAPHIITRSLFEFPKLTLTENANVSFQENARQKALECSQKTNAFSLAEESGLVIPVLGGLSYTFQSKKSRKDLSYLAQTKAILEDLKGKSEPDRQAYLECAIAVAHQNNVIIEATARIEGAIADREHGKISFDFDSIFIKNDYSKTLGELPEAVRVKISHRRKALERILPTLIRLQRTSS